jgi:repressor LexA
MNVRYRIELSQTERSDLEALLSGGKHAAFIHLYTRLHRRPPAETDMQEYFRVTPPSVHQMVLALERQGFIRRQPRTARSIQLLVDPKHLPELL